jgi:hypothetical protein
MSTILHDPPGNVVAAAGLSPRTITTSASGNAQDMIAGDGPCVAVQQIGTVSGTAPTLAGKLQESADGTAWADIPGAAFATVTASDNIQLIRFERTQKLLRYVATVGGTSPSFAVSALILQQRKSV